MFWLRVPYPKLFHPSRSLLLNANIYHPGASGGIGLETVRLFLVTSMLAITTEEAIHQPSQKKKF